MKIDERAALKRVTELMSIPGASGRERAAAEWIREQLLAGGARKSWITMDSAQKKSPHMDGGGDCGNLVLKLPGTFKAPRRLLMAHMDTVPLCEGCRPVRRGGRIVSAKKTTALGADDRAGCAAVLTAALEILKRKLPHPPLTFMWTVQEEVGLCGARYCSPGKLGNPKLVFSWDGGTPDRVTIGATGAYSMDIVIGGVASHAGGHPEEGVSAAAILGLAVADLQKNGWHGLVMKKGVRGSSNVGVVRGGEATNVVMDRLEVRAEARAHNKKLRKRVVAAYRKAFERAARSVKSSLGKRGRVSFKATFKYESFELAEDTPCVVEALRAVRAVGIRPKPDVGNGGLDANWMTARGLPAVTLGVGMRGAHKTSECLVIREHLDACRIALLLATPNGPNGV
ncbi:MAG: M20/M25/M40 family metallo-hydrolase [Planctomycetota bacterium]